MNVTKRESFFFPSVLLFALYISFSSSTNNPSRSWSSSSTYNHLIQCLENHTSENISSIVIAKTNATYSSVLDSYVRNLRFATSTTPKPQLIVTPLKPSHVSAVVVCCKSINMQIKIRSGGHDFEGLSYTSNTSPFIIVDMFNFRTIKVDSKKQTAYVQAGATLGELYYNIWKSSNVLGFPAGVCPTVGVGGHVSGGGYGNLLRKYGLSVDHIIDAEIVDVDGKILNRKSMGDDLFWAISGGGGGSFGVVLSFTFNLVPVPEKVTVFNVQRYLNQSATDLVYKWQSLMQDIDHNLFIRLLLQPVMDPQNRKQKTVRVTFIALFLGNANELVSLLASELPELGLKKQDCLEMSWIKSTLFWDNYDQETVPVEVLLNRTYDSKYLKRKSDYVQTPIPKQGLESLWKKLIQLGKPGMVFNAYGGRMSEIPANATPFPHRAGNLYKIQYSISWEEAGKAADDKYIDLIRQLYEFMTPYVSKNPRGAYWNYRDLDIGINRNDSFNIGRVYGKKYFMGNFDRLVQVKTRVDPTNFFRFEQSIPTRNAQF